MPENSRETDGKLVEFVVSKIPWISKRKDAIGTYIHCLLKYIKKTCRKCRKNEAVAYWRTTLLFGLTLPWPRHRQAEYGSCGHWEYKVKHCDSVMFLIFFSLWLRILDTF